MPSSRRGATPTVLFRPAAGPEIGGGHVMRDLSLATALSARGARCVFTVQPFGAAIVQRFGSEPFEIAARDRAASFSADLLVLDDYALDAAEQLRLRGTARRVVVIDDLADRPLAADLLIDPSYGREPADYAGKLPCAAQALLGPNYALLRPEFPLRRMRQGRPSRDAFLPLADSVERVFVSFGLSDVEGITERAVALVRQAFVDSDIDVVLAGSADSLPRLRERAARDAALHLHVDATNVVELLAKADVAIGAGGSATWERFCLGAPTLAVIVAENQRRLIETLDDQGFLLGCDLGDKQFEHRFLVALDHLRDPAFRADLGQRGLSLCDGRGAERAADALLSLL